MLEQNTITQFRSQLRGELIEPTDHRSPRLTARCADGADVVAAVRFGRENSLLVSIRGGGHNAAGLGVCDGGLVIDLALRKASQKARVKSQTSEVF